MSAWCPSVVNVDCLLWREWLRGLSAYVRSILACVHVWGLPLLSRLSVSGTGVMALTDAALRERDQRWAASVPPAASTCEGAAVSRWRGSSCATGIAGRYRSAGSTLRLGSRAVRSMMVAAWALSAVAVWPARND